MEADFWHDRWRDNAIPFHKAQTNPSLVKHFHNLGLNGWGDVFVPLCGKSVDMCWLREQGCTVTGVELSNIAVRDFFTEQGIDPEPRREGAFEILEADERGWILPSPSTTTPSTMSDAYLVNRYLT